ncbi:hypothetical protein GIB67_001443 [Kingdonia uniflora]|uniref:Ubiquitin-like protease family profile domain-containing protein n=1 Tax=Kingdonia uniflora TaxID=39325 RepID=A0A7J7L6S8_9MAGN|nr:hypothetical protein GIB67_001443 [Kingdonia uniflora]
MPTIEQPAVGTPIVGKTIIGGSSSATKIGAVVVRVCSQLEEHGKMSLKLDDHGKILYNHVPVHSTPEKTVKRKREEGNEKEDGKRKTAGLRTWQRDLQQKNQKIEEKEKGVAEVTKTDIVFFSQEEVFGEAYQASADQTTVVPVEEQTMEVEKLNIKLARVFNVWTRNMSSPKGVELKKKPIWDQILSMEWDRTVSYCFNRRDLKVVNSKLILIPWKINDNHWVLYTISFKGRKIYIYDSMVDAKIVNAQKKKLSPGQQRIEDQLSKILPKMLIWTDFADRSSPPTSSEVNNYGLNSKWTTHFGKYPIQPNGNDCGVYMLVFIDNILRGMKFPDLIDDNECRYTIAYDILRQGVEP